MPAPSEASPEGSTLFDKSAFDQTRNLCGVQVEAKQVGRYVALLKGYARAVHTTPHPLSPSNAPPPAPQLPLRRQKGPLRRRLSARAPLGRRQQRRQARPLQRGDRQGYQAPRCCSPTADLSELPEDIRKQLEGLSVVEYTVTTGYNEMSAGIPLHPPRFSLPAAIACAHASAASPTNSLLLLTKQELYSSAQHFPFLPHLSVHKTAYR